MKIALTGTPGTGKTSVAEELSEKFNVVNLTDFIKDRGLGEQSEKEFEVDVDAMVERLEEELEGSEDVLVEGHLAHHFPAEFCVVLRCRPDELRERLKQRDYKHSKIEENVESEALDVVLQEAVGEQENVIEIDTTEREVSRVGEEIEKRIEEEDTGYGKVDWSEYL